MGDRDDCPACGMLLRLGSEVLHTHQCLTPDRFRQKLAAAEAEVKKLKDEQQFDILQEEDTMVVRELNAQLRDENNQLKAEVERLNKAAESTRHHTLHAVMVALETVRVAWDKRETPDGGARCRMWRDCCAAVADLVRKAD